MDKSAESQIGELLTILAKLSPDVLSAMACAVGGGLTGGTIALGGTSLTATGSAVTIGAGAYAVGAGATAIALKGGIAVAIGAGASATAVSGVAVAIAPAIAAGIGIGALIGLLAYLVSTFAGTAGKSKED